jgi:hypothetical protein
MWRPLTRLWATRKNRCWSTTKSKSRSVLPRRAWRVTAKCEAPGALAPAQGALEACPTHAGIARSSLTQSHSAGSARMSGRANLSLSLIPSDLHSKKPVDDAPLLADTGLPNDRITKRPGFSLVSSHQGLARMSSPVDPGLRVGSSGGRTRGSGFACTLPLGYTSSAQMTENGCDEFDAYHL